jgi:hypothetical protein
LTPSKAAFLQTTIFEASTGTAGAEIIPSQLLFQKLVTMDDPDSSFNLSL